MQRNLTYFNICSMLEYTEIIGPGRKRKETCPTLQT